MNHYNFVCNYVFLSLPILFPVFTFFKTTRGTTAPLGIVGIQLEFPPLLYRSEERATGLGSDSPQVYPVTTDAKLSGVFGPITTG